MGCLSKVIEYSEIPRKEGVIVKFTLRSTGKVYIVRTKFWDWNKLKFLSLEVLFGDDDLFTKNVWDPKMFLIEIIEGA